MNLMDPQNPLSPFYRIVIRTPEQARLYNRLLVAKIVVQVIILIGLLALAGWSLKMMGFALAFAAAWKGIEVFMKKRRTGASS